MSKGEAMNRIIFATGNQGKLKEIKEIMAGLPLEVLSMKEAGLSVEVEENGSTFVENALIKARGLAALLKEKNIEAIAMADDSGLEIDALNKEPGVYSARYMGENTSYRIKNAKLIERLEGVPVEKRTARFVCEIAMVLPDGREKTARGTIEGKIGYEERGENGFGYDPIFYLPDMSRTTAELSPEDKNEISHRGVALRKIEKELADILA